MFEHHVKDVIWTYQQGLAKAKYWKLFESCGVYCITMQSTIYYLLVKKMYPLTRNLLHQLWSDIRLHVDHDAEMAYDLLRFHQKTDNGRIVGIKGLQGVTAVQDAKLLMEAIENSYGGNKESKKVQSTLLKQQYKNFAASSSETLDQTFNRLQKLISQLELQGKAELETISLDDLYNNLKRYEPKISGSSNTNLNPQNMAFVSSNSTSNTNETDTTASGVSTAYTQGITINSTFLDNLSDAMICAFLASQPNNPQLAKEDLEQIDPNDLEKMDLHWEMAMLQIRARRFMKRTGRNLDINGRRIGFDKTKVKCFNYHKNGHFARECRASKTQDNKGREHGRKTIPVETPTENALIAQDGIGVYDWSYQAEEETPTNYAFMALASSGSSSSSNSEADSCSKTCMKAYADLKKKYDSLTSNYKKELHALKRDLKLIDEHFESESVDVSTVSSSDDKTVKTINITHKGVFYTEEPKSVMKNSFDPSIIEDWHLNDDSEDELSPTEDMNLKLLRSLPSEWKTHTLIWRNKAELETINTTASGVSTAYTQEDLEQIDPDDLEKMDLHWEMAMLQIRARRFMKRTGKNLDINGQRIGFDKTKVECFNYHKNGHFARECRASKTQDNKGREYGRKTIPVETPIENALIAQDGIGGYDWSYQAEEETPTNYAFMALASSGSSSSSNSEADSCSKTCMKAYADLKKKYDSLTSNYKKELHALKRDLRLIDEHFESESVDVSTVSSSDDKTVKTIDITHK
nr:hypothetical protein [Tanacetum cinerariifolium]